MALTRFSISLDEKLLAGFESKIKADGCPTRSKAVGDLIRSSLVASEWQSGHNVAGAIVLVYDHHKRHIAAQLTDIQHEFLAQIISTQHIHLDHDNCLEIIAVRAAPAKIDALVKKLKAVKGLKHASVAAATTGKQV